VSLSKNIEMKTLLALVSGLVIAAPAHAVPIISLHSAVCNVQIASTAVDFGLLLASVAALTVAVAYRVYRRKAAWQQDTNHR